VILMCGGRGKPCDLCGVWRDVSGAPVYAPVVSRVLAEGASTVVGAQRGQLSRLLASGLSAVRGAVLCDPTRRVVLQQDMSEGGRKGAASSA